MRVLSVASEAFPLIKTGGLADVAGALPRALAAADVEMRVMLPGYREVIGALGETKVVKRFKNLFGSEARLLSGPPGTRPHRPRRAKTVRPPRQPYLARQPTGRTTGSVSPRSARGGRWQYGRGLRSRCRPLP
jgi:hypothetical protein